MSTTASFRGWRLNANGIKDPEGPFEIECYSVQPMPYSKIKWELRVQPTRQKIAGSWDSEEKAKSAAIMMFREQEQDWL